MRTVNVSEARIHLSRLLKAAAAGEEIVIARAGKPLAKLVVYHEDERSREPGCWRGKVYMADDFDVLPDTMAAVFRGDVP